MEMRGKMVEADFETDELIFKMYGNYYARAGSYIIMPVEEFQRDYEPRKQIGISEMMKDYDERR